MTYKQSLLYSAEKNLWYELKEMPENAILVVPSSPSRGFDRVIYRRMELCPSHVIGQPLGLGNPVKDSDP